MRIENVAHFARETVIGKAGSQNSSALAGFTFLLILPADWFTYEIVHIRLQSTFATAAQVNSYFEL